MTESRKKRELGEERRSLETGSGRRCILEIDGGCGHTKSSSAEEPSGVARVLNQTEGTVWRRSVSGSLAVVA